MPLIWLLILLVSSFIFSNCNPSSGKRDGKNILSWEKRNKIAIDIAKALEFLHHGDVTQSVIHGDVKSSNILLSEDFEAKVNIHINL